MKQMVIACFGDRFYLQTYLFLGMKLIFVNHINDIYGRDFDGVIIHFYKRMNDFQKAAFDELKKRQPELFNENKGEK